MRNRARGAAFGWQDESVLHGAFQMVARAYWKGQIRLALVSIPVEIYAATKSGATLPAAA